jgi:hypothetical protein
MQLIAISEDVLINPDKISTIQITRSKAGKSKVTIVVDDRTFEVSVAPKELLLELKRTGVDLTEQFFSV